MSRTVRRCPNPECRSTAWSRRVGSIQGGHGEGESRYRCGECGERFDELEESETDRPGNISIGPAAELARLGEEHDGDVPIPGGESA
jgi:hypothetical protein